MLITLYPRNSDTNFLIFYYDISAIVTCRLQMTLKYQTFGNMIRFTLFRVYRNQNRQK